MRVGFVTPLLWHRFGPPWAAMVADLGAEVVRPRPEAVVEALEDHRARAVAPLAPRLAVAAALACGACDLLIAPALFASEGGPGAAQDPWAADLGVMLGRALPSAGPVVEVPAEGGPGVAGMVMPVLTRINRDAGRARLAWERQRSVLERPPGVALLPARAPAGEAAPAAPARPRLALVAHPWWLTREGAALAGRGAGALQGQHLLDPVEVRGEGRRVRADFVAPDAEAIGAARRFGRQAGVDVVRLLVDPESATASWLERRVREAAGRKLEVVSVHELAEPAAWARALTPAEA